MLEAKLEETYAARKQYEKESSLRAELSRLVYSQLGLASLVLGASRLTCFCLRGKGIVIQLGSSSNTNFETSENSCLNVMVKTPF